MVYLYLHAGSDRGAQLTDALASAMSLRGLGASVGLSPHSSLVLPVVTARRKHGAVGPLSGTL